MYSCHGSGTSFVFSQHLNTLMSHQLGDSLKILLHQGAMRKLDRTLDAADMY